MLSLSYSWLRLPSSLDLKLEIVKKRGVGSAGFGMGSTNEYGWFGVGYKMFLLVIASCRRILVIRLGRKERPQYNSPHCSSRTLLAKSLSGSSLARDKLQRKMCKSSNRDIPFHFKKSSQVRAWGYSSGTSPERHCWLYRVNALSSCITIPVALRMPVWKSTP